MLGDRIDEYKETGKGILRKPASYKAEHPWLKEVDSLALANVQLDLQRAYKEFFGEKTHRYTEKTIAKAKRQGRQLTFYDYEKHPKFKSRRDTNWHSYTTNNQNGTVAVVDKYLKLPKIGLVRCKFHRQIPNDHKIKSATISMSSTGKFYVAILVEFETNTKFANPETYVGLDFSMKELYVDHENNCPDFHRFYRESEDKLAREQRKLSRMVKGSNNYNKQKLKVNKIHEKIANQRKDRLHKESYSITKKYDVVCVEDLDMKAMSRTLNFGKSVTDNGWGIFTRLLEYKQYWNGHYFVKIDKWYPSSKLCHVCGCLNDELTLDMREWTCESCGTFHLRDQNAAINIRREGKRVLAEKLAA
jgi:putative transposase